MNSTFDPFRYDKYLALKVTPLLWVILLWSMHHALLLMLSAFSRSGYVFHVASEYAYNVPLLACNLPAFILLLIALNRSPTSGKYIKWLWHHGKLLLIIAIACSAAVTVIYHPKMIFNPDSLFFWALLIDTAAILFLMLSRHISEIFADFPSEIASDGNSTKRTPKP